VDRRGRGIGVGGDARGYKVANQFNSTGGRYNAEQLAIERNRQINRVFAAEILEAVE
jgi:hypothetical protein